MRDPEVLGYPDSVIEHVVGTEYDLAATAARLRELLSVALGQLHEAEKRIARQQQVIARLRDEYRHLRRQVVSGDQVAPARQDTGAGNLPASPELVTT